MRSSCWPAAWSVNTVPSSARPVAGPTIAPCINNITILGVYCCDADNCLFFDRRHAVSGLWIATGRLNKWIGVNWVSPSSALLGPHSSVVRLISLLLLGQSTPAKIGLIALPDAKSTFESSVVGRIGPCVIQIITLKVITITRNR